MIEKTEKEIMKNWRDFDLSIPMVSIRCITFNHVKYISKAFDSFLSQKTTFPFEIVVHDDCSTDGTTEIIKEYEKKFPHIFVCIYETENQWSKKMRFTKKVDNACHGKYIALCEGDDYWIDDDKIQKQFDFMEKNQEYTMCLSNSYKYDDITKELIPMDVFSGKNEISIQDQIEAGLTKDFPATASYFFPKSLLDKILPVFCGYVIGDYPLRLWFASNGKTYCFSEPMVVYRVNNGLSQMGKLKHNTRNYYKHLENMIRLWENMDKYFSFQFHNLFEPKINDAIWGMCMCFSEDFADLDKVSNGKANEILRVMDKNYLPKEIIGLKENNSDLYIFGQSLFAKRCAEQLQNHDIHFNGFVISDGYPKDTEFMDQFGRIYSLSEINKSSNIIIAAQPKNAEIISKELIANGFDKIFKPFILN